MNQDIIDRAVNMATGFAMSGTPVEQIIWLEPQTGSEDPRGNFVVRFAPVYKAWEKAPWE